MDWLASLSTDWVLGIAFVLVFARLALFSYRKSVGPKHEHSYGELIESLLFAWVTVFLVVRPFAYEPFSIPSESMVDTLHIGDRIIVNKYAYRFHPPQRGDVVVFKSPPEAKLNEADFVKRLIGLPGDTLDIQDGKLVINGKVMDEPYVWQPPFFPNTEMHPPPYVIPPDHYFMMGDNRNNSADSRYWGPLEAWRIKGKAVCIFWPPRRMQILRHYKVDAPPPQSQPQIPAPTPRRPVPGIPRPVNTGVG